MTTAQSCITVIATVCVAAACAHKGSISSQHQTTATTQAGALLDGKALLTDVDRIVLEKALNDLLHFDDFTGVGIHDGPKPEIVLHTRTIDQEFTQSIDNQTRSDIEGGFRWIPDDTYENLVERNPGAITLSPPLASTGSIVVINLDEFWAKQATDSWDAFESAYPNAKGYVYARLPGYSIDGKTAVVRLHVGPSPHGETATYLLHRHSKGWIIKWRVLTHYF